MKNPAAIFWLLFLLSTGCRSTKEPYLFKHLPAETKASFSAPLEITETSYNLPPEPNKTVAFPAPKLRNGRPEIVSSGTESLDHKFIISVKLLAAKQENLQKTTAIRLSSGNRFNQVLTHSRQKFPVVWFIILSAIIAALLIAFAASGKGMPSFGEIFLLLMFPFAIAWLLIIAKALAPAGFGFIFFLAMILAIILLIVFLNWLTKVQRRARSERYRREYKRKQLEDEQVP